MSFTKAAKHLSEDYQGIHVMASHAMESNSPDHKADLISSVANIKEILASNKTIGIAGLTNASIVAACALKQGTVKAGARDIVTKVEKKAKQALASASFQEKQAYNTAITLAKKELKKLQKACGVKVTPK